MNLFEYLDDQFKRANLEMQKDYKPSDKAKTMAISKILNHQKSIYTFLFYFVFIFDFLKRKFFGFEDKIDLQKELSKIAEERKRISKEEECAQDVEKTTTNN